MSTSEQKSILTRLAALERQNRRLRWMMLGMVVLLTAGVCLPLVNVGARAAPFRKPRADKLVLRDETGKERIVLKTDKDEPRIQFFSSKGKLVALIGGSDKGGYLLFSDAEEIPRLEMSAGNIGAFLHFMDEKSVPRMDLSASDNPLLRFRDEKGHQILEVLKDGPKLTFFDKKGKPLFTKP